MQSLLGIGRENAAGSHKCQSMIERGRTMDLRKHCVSGCREGPCRLRSEHLKILWRKAYVPSMHWLLLADVFSVNF